MTTKRKTPANGLILYRGPSKIDGRPIVAVAVNLRRRSKNGKTGNMVAIYILSDAGVDPLQAIKDGEDRSICGDCPHRGTTCYVNVSQAPLSIYRGVQRGAYPTFHAPKHLDLFEGRHIRFGSYGDPAALPLWILILLSRVSDGWTGYTHQWRTCDPRVARFCMASCETAAQREEAAARGYRTFRVRLEGQAAEKGEFVCPASEEAGKRLTCEECGACNGTGGRKDGPGGKVSPVIVFHGPKIANNFRLRTYTQTVQRLEAEEAGSRRFPLN